MDSLEYNLNEPFAGTKIIIEFCDNESSIFPLKFGDQHYGFSKIPYLLPLSYGTLNLTLFSQVLNDTLFVPYPIMPKWDGIQVDEY